MVVKTASFLFERANPGTQKFASIILGLSCLTWFVFLYLIASLKPDGFVIDEDAYLLPILYGLHAQQWALDLRLLSPIPSYLYFWLYSFLPAHHILSAAITANAGFIAGTALPAYGVASRYLRGSPAVVFAIFVVCSPISSFVRYVMPEPVYFFGFWLVVLAMLSGRRNSLLPAALAGSLIGALSLIKPHALALALGGSAFFLLRDLRVLNALALLVSYYFVRVVLAYVLTGRWLLSLAGSTYGIILRSGYRVDLSASGANAIGHVCALAMLLAVPITISVTLAFQRIFRTTPNDDPAISPIVDLALLACCMLAAMLAMTVYYSQAAYQHNPIVEHITRLYGRYYDYAFPLFILVTVSMWKRNFDFARLCARPVVVALCISALVAAVVVIDVFHPSDVDFPDLALAHVGARYANYTLLSLLLFPCVLSCFSSKRIKTADLILWATLSCSFLAVSTSAAIIKFYCITFIPHNPVDIAFFRSTGERDLERLAGRLDGFIVATPGDFDVYRTIFYLHSLTPVGVIATVGDDGFPKEARWAVPFHAFTPRVTWRGTFGIVIKS